MAAVKLAATTIMEKCDLWTGDMSLYQAVKGELAWVKWIGDYKVGKEL